ncbi:MAG: Rossmann-fold NAD(P)-binding domain-containing protein [Terriglobia bacterium]
MIIGIVGYGVVGKALAKTFERDSSDQDLRIYDKGLAGFNDAKSKYAIQTCDIVFVAVPTPESADGSCDISAVREVAAWVKPPMCLKSTVPPGTVDSLAAATGKSICFSPEYVGETKWHPLKRIETHGFIIVGGEKSVCDLVVRAYQKFLGPLTHYYITDAKTAELCKYMENAFLATKVAFVNQFYDLARAYGVNYNELREIWLADERVGRSHTIVTEERGYRGRCLPKDMAAIIHAAKMVGGAPLLEAVDRYNDEVCRASDKTQAKSHRQKPEKITKP